jgi:glycosyltransferase involved in cell wall biosynthesis
LPDFLRRFPDFRELEATGVVAQRSRVLPIGLDLATLDRARPVERETGPPRILWNHRWEHDKAPERFFAAIDMLVSRGLDFELVLLGESFVRLPEVLEAARDRLGDRIRHFGFVADRAAYARWLWQSDLVVSTARHEFFGTAVCEAAYCGCLALVPRQLAYPEIFAGAQARWLYDADGFQDRLADELQALAERPLLVRDESLRDAMGRFAWPIVVADYDAAFSELLRQGRPPRVLY